MLKPEIIYARKNWIPTKQDIENNTKYIPIRAIGVKFVMK